MTAATALNLAQSPELVRSNSGKTGCEKPLSIFGEDVYIKVDGKQTGGAWSMIEQVSPPGGGPPVHCHSREDESFYVVEGELLFLVGEERIAAHAGDFLWAPRNIPHTFLNVGAVPSRVTVVMSPSGMEEFFLKLAAIPGPPNPDLIAPLFAEYGLQLLGPPITA
jgi:quercetin dioxygenase-like cupin family protein